MAIGFGGQPNPDRTIRPLDLNLRRQLLSMLDWYWEYPSLCTVYMLRICTAG